jgi:hypothetical protein
MKYRLLFLRRRKVQQKHGVPDKKLYVRQPAPAARTLSFQSPFLFAPDGWFHLPPW